MLVHLKEIFFKIRMNKIMSEDQLTNTSLLFIKHEHLKLSFDSVIDNFADVKSQKNYGVLFITLVGS